VFLYHVGNATKNTGAGVAHLV